jgi:TRAP-type C4-dicarboxylate transport system permease large subunit
VANEKATVGAIPGYMGFFVVISLLIFFPALSLWLPALFDLV